MRTRKLPIPQTHPYMNATTTETMSCTYAGHTGSTGLGNVYWALDTSTCTTTQRVPITITGTTTGSSSMSIATSTLTVDNPTFDLWAGIILMFVVMYGMIWFFKRK